MVTVPKSSHKKGFFIEVGCPGCGGELEIDSDFFVTGCSHCGTPLRLILPETPAAYLIPFKLSQREARFKIDRQLKSLGLPLTGQSLIYKQVYYPYWKVDAMLLRCRNRKEKISVSIDDNSGEETIDYKKNTMVSLAPYQVSVAASSHIDGVPDSLGIRGQSLNVVPLASSKIDEETDLLDVRRSPAEVVKTIELSVSRMNTIQLADFGENLTRIFNPETTLLYFPIIIAEDYAGEGYRRYVLDGLTGKVLSRFDSEEGESETIGKEIVRQQSNVFDLAVNIFDEFDAGSALGAQNLDIPENALRLQPNDDSNLSENPQVNFGALKIVFHRCEVCGEDLPPRSSCLYICKNCHELTCLDNKLPVKPRVYAAVDADKSSSYFPFWTFKTNNGRQLGLSKDAADIVVPAFTMPNFEALYRLSRRMSTAIGQMECAEIEVLDNRFAPVDILPTEAMTLANVTAFRYALEKTNKLPKQELNLISDQVTLNYIPFRPEHYFFVDTILNSVTFEKKLVTA